MATAKPDIAAEAERLNRLAVETGDARFALAAAVLVGPGASVNTKRRRDDAIRSIAARHFPAMSTWPAAQEIARQLDRYVRRRWCRDQHAATCPRDIAGKLDGDLWALCVDCGTDFYSMRTVHRALSV